MAQNTKYGWRVRTQDGPKFFEKKAEAMKFCQQKNSQGEQVETPKKHALPAKMYKISHKGNEN